MLALKRCPLNPILGPNPDLPWGGHEARNPGVIFDGENFHMVFTATPDPGNGEIYLGHAVSGDGIHFECEPEPLLRPSPNPDDFDHASVEDARITELDGNYFIAYAARSCNMLKFAAGERRIGPEGNRNPTWTENFRRAGFAVTKDWRHCRKLGPITSEHICDANVVLFPEKCNNKFLILHRPTAAIPWALPCFYSPGAIWLAFSNSLERWSSNRREMPWNMVDGEDIPDDHLLIRPEFEWEKMKIGAAGVPIPTDDGWLMFYHAVDRRGVYRVGLLLLDRQNPLHVLARSPLPVMQPEGTFEQSGAYPNCIFPCANLVAGDEIFMYYGAADLYSCLATVKLSDALAYINQHRIRENRR